MVKSLSRLARAVAGLLALGIFLHLPAPAFAHKLNVFVESLEGATIHGYAYFPGDVAARQVDVIIRDGAGRELGRTVTDDKGKFTFTARARVDHYLVAETAEGHRGQYIVHAAALPDSLPADGPAPDSSSHGAPSTAEPPGAPPASQGKESEPVGVRDQLSALGRQVDELRWQVCQYEDRLRFRDILGGIGYILGIAGVAFYIRARGKNA
jgi:nickel transport protein